MKQCCYQKIDVVLDQDHNIIIKRVTIKLNKIFQKAADALRVVL